MNAPKPPPSRDVAAGVGFGFLIVGVSIVAAIAMHNALIVAAGFGGFMIACAVGYIISVRR